MTSLLKFIYWLGFLYLAGLVITSGCISQVTCHPCDVEFTSLACDGPISDCAAGSPCEFAVPTDNGIASLSSDGSYEIDAMGRVIEAGRWSEIDSRLVFTPSGFGSYNVPIKESCQ